MMLWLDWIELGSLLVALGANLYVLRQRHPIARRKVRKMLKRMHGGLVE